MKKFVMIAATLLATGCASTGSSLQDYKSVAGSTKNASVSSSVLNSAPKINLGQQLSGDINKIDPLFLNAGYAANYDAYKLEIPSAGKYHINLKSLCDCLGFSKTLIYPSIQVLDRNMKAQSITDASILPGEATTSLLSASLPAHLNANWNVEVKSAGTYYLVVAPNNKDIEKGAFDLLVNLKINNQNSYGGMAIPINREITIHPYGKYIATVEKHSLL